MQYHFKVHKEAGAFWAQCLELPGCVTQAETIAELQQNMHEALNLFIDEQANVEDLAALPDKTIKLSKTVVAVNLDLHIAFAFLIRYWRIKNGLTQKEAAKQMGFDTLYSYQRLETKKCNPSLKIISKVKSVYPELSIDSILAGITNTA